jgi:hypothetical protein
MVLLLFVIVMAVCGIWLLMCVAGIIITVILSALGFMDPKKETCEEGSLRPWSYKGVIHRYYTHER